MDQELVISDILMQIHNIVCNIDMVNNTQATLSIEIHNDNIKQSKLDIM
jgi:hypothetical protein